MKKLIALVAGILAGFFGWFRIRTTKQSLEEFKEKTEEIESKIEEAKVEAEAAVAGAERAKSNAEKLEGLAIARREEIRKIENDKDRARDFNARRRRK